MPITMTELARQLQLSQSTVSLVLNHRDKKRIRPEIAARVRAAAKEAGFRPNRAAGQLRRQRSYAVGILLPSPRNVYYAELIAEMHRAVHQHGYAPIFAFWENEAEQSNAVDSVLGWNPDAVITVEPSLIPENAEMPVVSFYQDDPRFDCVQLDLAATVRLQLEHFRSLGHRHAAWLGNSDDCRLPILRKLAPSFDIELRNEHQICNPGILSFEDGRALFDQLLAQSGDTVPTAIFAHNDMVALGVLRRMLELGYQVPRDFSLIGHDAIGQGAFSSPSLTTVTYAAKESAGRLLVETVLARLKNPDAPRVVHAIEPELVIRESTGAVRTTPLVLANNQS